MPSYSQYNPGSLFDNRYFIDTVLGYGGMGKVYKVRDSEVGDMKALKVHSNQPDQPFTLSRFQREFATLHRLNHPNIVQVYDFARSQDGLYYFTMEYLEGHSLNNKVTQINGHSLLKNMVSILETLQFIHTKGLIHGDIKPQNIIIPFSSTGIKLTDFGMVEKVSLQRTGPIQGTITYMSPEVIRGSGIDQRSDIYSFGVMMYEIVGGSPPFADPDPLKTLRMHLTQEPSPIVSQIKDFPVYCNKIIMRCLEKKPSERYQSAEEILREIKCYDPDIIVEETTPFRESFVLSAEFVGRKSELSFLTKLSDYYRNGSGQVVLITGENGIGKSRLIHEFILQQQLHGYTVISTRCNQKDSRPNQSIIDLCSQLLHICGETGKAITEKYSSELVKLAPTLLSHGQIVPTPRSTDQQSVEDPIIERTHFHDALTQLFVDISHIRPYVICIEDLHWVDSFTLEILRYFIRNIKSASIMICCTYPSEVSTRISPLDGRYPLNEIILENKGNDYFHQLPLGSLKTGEVSSIVSSMLGLAYKPEEFSKKLHKMSGGNPFIITEMMKKLVNENIIYRKQNEWVIDIEDSSLFEVPVNVSKIYQTKLSHIDTTSKSVLEFLSIPSNGVMLSLLLKWLPFDAQLIFEKLNGLVDAEILSLKNDYYEFSNPLVKNIIYNQLTEQYRKSLHQEYALMLVNTHNNPEVIVSELAYHFFKAKKTEEAQKYSIMAAKASESVYSHEEAIKYYEQALRLVDQYNTPNTLLLLRKLIDLFVISGNYKAAIEKIEVLFKFIDKNQLIEIEEICTLNRKAAGIYEKTGEYDKALKYLYDSLALVGDKTESFIRAQIHTNLGNIFMLLGDFDKAIHHCQKSTEIVEPLGNIKELSEISNTYGKIYFRKRKLDKALLYFTRNLQLREKIGDTFGIGRAYTNLGLISDEMSHPQDAEDYYQSALKIFEKINFIYGSASIYNNLGTLYHYFKTDWEKGIVFLLKASDLHERSGNFFGIAMTAWNLGIVYKDIGKYLEAEKQLRKALSIYRTQKNNYHIAIILTLLANLELEKNNLKTAIEILNECENHVKLECDDELYVTFYLEKARLFLLQGNDDQASQFCDKAKKLLSSIDDNELKCHSLLLEADIHNKRNNQLEREKALLTCVLKLRTQKPIFLFAKVQWYLSVFYNEIGNIRKAIEHVEKATDIFRKIGIAKYYDRAQELLTSLRKKVLPDFFKFDGDQSDIKTLYHISHDLNSTLNLPALHEKILDVAIKTVHAERGLLILYDEIRQNYSVKVARNMDQRTCDDMATISGGVVERAVQQGLPILSSDAMLDPRFKENQSVILFSIKSIMCAPLIFNDRTIGALYLDNRSVSHQFTERDMDFLTVLANQASIALDNAILFERYNTATDNLNTGIIVMRKNGIISNCNNQAANMMELTKNQLINLRCSPTMKFEFLSPIGTILYDTLKLKTPQDTDIKTESSQGTVKILHISTSLMFDAFGELYGIIGILKNVTRDKKLREELKLQQRLHAIGDLASKISDRMRNFFSQLKILTENVDRLLTEQDVRKSYVDEILLEISEAERYVLQELSPQQSPGDHTKQIDIITLLKQLVVSILPECRDLNISIVQKINTNTALVTCIPTQLLEVFNNILKNAMQAIGQNGEITITTCKHDRNIIVEILDNGPGFPEFLKQKIFEPFFTTKDEGSGVGLWIAHRIITSINGQIQVDSKPDGGTCFSVVLPLSG